MQRLCTSLALFIGRLRQVSFAYYLYCYYSKYFLTFKDTLVDWGVYNFIFRLISLTSRYYDVFFAALYGSNIRFYFTENQYFKSDNTQSFVLHFWSLSLEEQFYIFFPAVFVVFYAVTNCFKLFNRLAITLFVSLLGMTSFACCFIPIMANQKFFLLHARIWEFLLGSVCSLFEKDINDKIALWKEQLSVRYDSLDKDTIDLILSYIRWGVLGILTIFCFYTSNLDYPNYWTLIIVLLTCVLLCLNIPVHWQVVCFVSAHFHLILRQF
jgi:peptidoglycan/LPS O-acetylase OafA/YrhL